MKFVFVSHGINSLASKQIAKLVGKDNSEIKVLYIDTPANTYPTNPPWLVESKEELKKFGFSVIDYDIEEAFNMGEDIEKAFEGMDIVAISGGNTFYFLYWAEKVGLKEKLVKYLDAGGVYMGESAGVVCQIKDLEPIKWADDPNDAPGLIKEGMQLTDLVIIPHWENFKYESVLRKIRDYYVDNGIRPYLLRDGDVMVVNGKNLVLIKTEETETVDSFSAGGVVVDAKGRVCVVNQDGDSWSLPKGHVDPGESPLDAAR